MSQHEQAASPAIPALDPLAVAQAATGGAVRDPLREMLVNAAELNRQTTGQARSIAQTDTANDDRDSASNRETTEQVQRANGDTVTTIL